MTPRDWERCLDLLAEQVAQQREAVRRGDLAGLQVFVPDEDLGPLPGALRQRADELLSACTELADELREARDRTASDLASVVRPRGATGASYVDSRA